MSLLPGAGSRDVKDGGRDCRDLESWGEVSVTGKITLGETTPKKQKHTIGNQNGIRYRDSAKFQLCPEKFYEFCWVIYLFENTCDFAV